jgi:hypothetical protein
MPETGAVQGYAGRKVRESRPGRVRLVLLLNRSGFVYKEVKIGSRICGKRRRALQ